ncbi:MAG: class I SAM-dependent methyltransferase [bacterium]|nr:class I SAM-dependent methyltransferase [bacterium]
MGLYSKYLMPRIVDFACRGEPNRRQREKVVPRAAGRVLEIGAGSGLNLPHYDPGKVEHLFALEPSAEMWAMSGELQRKVEFTTQHVAAGAEAIPLESATVDTVLVTYSLCTIPNPTPALEEMRRVLRLDGELVFCEHGLAPDAGVRRWQRRLNPIWKRMGGGCNLDRDIPGLVRDGGFDIREMQTMYLPGLKPATYNYWGVASPRP